MNKNYRIGLDIGIGSVGWAVLENDPLTEEPTKILDLGVRVFSPNEVAKTGESTASARRGNRGIRRRLRRKELRFKKMKTLFKTYLNIDSNNIDFNSDIYYLRAKALDEQISLSELERIVLNILKRRGFKSNRKNLVKKEDGILLNAINENSKFVKDNGYRTIGEAIFKDSNRFKTENCGHTIYSTRNHFEEYKNCFLRDDLKFELEQILKSQQRFYYVISNEFIEKVLTTFEAQRNFDEGPGVGSPYSAKFEIGKCTFYANEYRAPKAGFTFEYFSALSKINNLKIDDIVINNEQKNILIENLLTSHELKFDKVRKLLNIENNKYFNLCKYNIKQSENKELSQEEMYKKCENTNVFVSLKNSASIAKAINVRDLKNNIEIIDKIALMLSTCKSDVTIDSYIVNNDILHSLSQEQINNLKKLNFDKFGSLSTKAMKQIIPYLEQGQRYDDACKNAGFNHSSFEHPKMKYLKGEQIDERMKDITSNVVKRSVNQALRIVNEIIKKYGSPQFVSIELARELAKNLQDRKSIKDQQKKNQENNDKVKQILENEFHLTRANGQDILKYKLYKDQDGKCMYSGKPIDISRLFEPNYLQIDHILPYSKSMNDSYNNKVLVIADENQNKGDKTPYEYFGQNEVKWNEFVARVNLLKNREKQRFLLKTNFDDEAQKSFIDRNLNDTQYMAKFIYELIENFLEMNPSKKYKKQIRTVNGAVTSYLRKCWGINKIRDDGDIHHCIDAVIISTVGDSVIQKITQFNKFKEIFKKDDKTGMFVNLLTGEIMTAEERKSFEGYDITLEKERLPMPYPSFKEELTIRSRVDYKNDLCFTEEEKFQLRKLGYEEDEISQIKPVFVSRMKTIKKSGAIHEDTMMSPREYNETKNLIKTVPITSLKLKNGLEKTPLKDDKYPEFFIENYYRPQDDRLLYLKLKEYLVENKNISKDMKFYKPKSDGTNGPIVKTVKIYQKVTNCVITPHGVAKNDSMHRIDVYEKDDKFYLCPIYKSDVYAHKLPNKLIMRYKDWLEIDNSFNFKFSLYKNDLIKITSNNDIIFKKNFSNPKSTKPDEIDCNTKLVYYNSTDISSASIECLSFDNCYVKRGIGVKTLKNIEKYYVDIMGNIYKAPNETRQEL